MNFFSAAIYSDDKDRSEDAAAFKDQLMAEISHIVDNGDGMLTRLESGTFELRLATGHIFHLGEHSITRIA